MQADVVATRRLEPAGAHKSSLAGCFIPTLFIRNTVNALYCIRELSNSNHGPRTKDGLVGTKPGRHIQTIQAANRVIFQGETN